MLIVTLSYAYKKLARPIFFLFDPEAVHNFVTGLGEVLGEVSELNAIISKMFSSKSKVLKQEITGI